MADDVRVVIIFVTLPIHVHDAFVGDEADAPEFLAVLTLQPIPIPPLVLTDGHQLPDAEANHKAALVGLDHRNFEPRADAILFLRLGVVRVFVKAADVPDDDLGAEFFVSVDPEEVLEIGLPFLP
ncbi:hypothetical protein V7798_15790 [Rhizobium laguerreae]